METGTVILIAVTLLGAGIPFFLPPIPQPENYHNFADKRKKFGIPNGLDVLSNLPFCIVGLLGIWKVTAMIGTATDSALLTTYLTFFTGVFLTGLGSGWYHLKPNNESLVWDRLPMTIAFAGFFCAVLSELVSLKAGALLLLPLLFIGLFSVIYWIKTERAGRGDLRLYGIVQFLPMILIPLMLMFYDGPAGYKPWVWGLIGFYALAKVFETLDNKIYSFGKVVSGHTLKHIAAAAGTGCLLAVPVLQG